MKKILCPCDFSAAALQGIEYAVEIAKRINADITICHVQPSVWPEAVFLEPIVEESLESAEAKLLLIAGEIEQNYGVRSSVMNPRSIDTVEKTIGNLSEEYDLIIMGTNGVDDAFQYLFGSTSFNVARYADCPVLLIPESCDSAAPEGLIYLHHERVNPGLDILVPLWWSQLMNIPFGIWVLPGGNDQADHQLARTISEELRSGGPENLISFVKVFPDHEYKAPGNNWVKALPIHHHRTSALSSGRKLLRKYSSTSNTPVLIFPIND
ncbi:MAG: universal stress protein [Cyclobacteriaceae bacterium]